MNKEVYGKKKIRKEERKVSKQTEGRERNSTRILGARASTTSFRGRSCHPSDSKSQSYRS